MPTLRFIVLLVMASWPGCGWAHADMARVPADGGPHARDETPAARRTIAPGRTAQATSPAAASSSSLVVISVQASEDDALASFKVLQAKYPAVLGSYQAIIKRVDLGDKGGVRYRVAVGPFETKQQASAMCGSLKLAGGQCFPTGNQ